MKQINTISIKCETSEKLEIAEMTEMQGGLKERTCRQIAGLLQHFRTNGHINARYTSLNMEDEDIRKYKLEYLLRIEINKAMWQEKDKFMEHWNALGHIIYEYSDKYGDEFNKQYESKRKKH